MNGLPPMARYWRIMAAAGFMLTLAVVAAGWLYNRPQVQIKFCERPGLSEAAIAEHRGLSVEMFGNLKLQRGLTNADICGMPQAKLDRAIFRTQQPKPDRPDEAIAWRQLQLQDENGVVPADGYQKAHEHIEQMRQSAQPGQPAAGIEPAQWQWIGPGNIGGRVRAMVIHPTQPNRMWAGSVSGGIWYTSDGGSSWRAVDDFMANLAVSTLIIDPKNSNVLYAGTGEGFFNNDAVRGAGVFKSIDGGVTWNQLATTANDSWYFVNRLAISANGTTLLAATGSGIWRSSDGGTSWTQALSGLDSAGNSVLPKDVDFSPNDASKAVASGSFGQAWYSTNGGTSWTQVANFFGLDLLKRIEVAYAPTNSSIVYASVNQNSGTIWKSTNGGQSYSQVNIGNNYLGGQGWYDNSIWVDPTNPNILIVGGVDLWRSSDGGITLNKISQWYSSPPSAHADHHAIVPHPSFNGTTNRTVFFGNDGGIYKAEDVYTVESLIGWQELNNNLGITQFYGAAGNPTTGKIIGGTQDNGTLLFNGSSESWTTTFGGDGGFSGADPTNPNYFYGEYVFANVHRSSDGGDSADFISGQYFDGTAYQWKNTPYRITDARDSKANFIAPFILDVNEPNRMYVGGHSLWRTNNVRTANTDTSGPAWAAIKNPTLDNSEISAIAVAPGNSNSIWVGHNNGAVYKTTNGLAALPTWTQVDGVTLPDRYVTRITISPTNVDIVYVTFGGFTANNIYRTTNAGTSWSPASGSGNNSLPNAPVRSLVINPTNPAWLYVGTEVGVFTSEDSGATWSLPQDGPANVSVDELFWMGDDLIAATHGRGLYRASLGIALSISGLRWEETIGNGNNAIDPGETIRVEVDLTNRGTQPAVGANGVLSSRGGNVAIIDGNASYGNLDFGTTVTANPGYTFKVSQAQACAGGLSFRQIITHTGGQQYTHDFTLPLGSNGAATNYAYSGPDVSVPDPGTVDVPITIAASGSITDIDVRVTMVHPYDADIKISLVSPSGTAITLSNGNGGNNDNYTGTIFDDEATSPIASGSPPYTGRFRPEQVLSALDGSSLTGVWQLRLQDTAIADTGLLTDWSMDVQPQVCSSFNVAPAVSLSSTSLSFADQPVGASSAAQTVTLQNTGTGPLSLTSLSLSGDFARAGGTCPTSLPATLSPGASCTIEVAFSPTAAGARTGSLSLASDAPGSPHTVSLTGVGVVFAPAVSLSSSSLSFADQLVGASSAAQTVTLQNTGTGPLSLTSLSLSGDFARAGGTCPTSLPASLSPGASCTIEVAFSPTAVGARSGSLSLASDAPSSPHTVSLNGVGVVFAPAVSLSSSSLSFADQLVGTSSAAQTVTLQNTGTGPLSLTSLSLSGDFARAGGTCPTSLPASLSPGASCTIGVAFSPAAAGARSGSLSLVSDAPGSPHTVSLNGVGTVSQPAETYRVLVPMVKR